MDIQILVAYSSKYGATAQIAERIGQVLRRAGITTDVLPVDQVNSLERYAGVVLGSGVYIGRWRKDAATFLKANEGTLARKMVWLFSSGPTGEQDLAESLQGWQFSQGLQPIVDRIQPRNIAVFRGMLDTTKLNVIEKWVLKNVKSPTGDYRDWDAITSWAETISAAMEQVDRETV